MFIHYQFEGNLTKIMMLVSKNTLLIFFFYLKYSKLIKKKKNYRFNEYIGLGLKSITDVCINLLEYLVGILFRIMVNRKI
jgi:hypothetical protein